MFDGGEEAVHVQASGGEMLPAFEAEIAFPLAVIVQTPAIGAGSIVGASGSDLVLTWERGAADTGVVVRGETSDASGSGVVVCRFDSLAGHGTIPAALTSIAAAPFTIQTVATKTLDVGSPAIELRATMPVRHKDNETTSVSKISFE